MKRILFSLVLILFFINSQSVLAANNQRKPGVISVHSSATKEVDSNYASIKIGVETFGKNLDFVTMENKTKSLKVVNALRQIVDEKSGDTLKTSNYYVHPNFNFSKDRKKTLNGYWVSNTIIVKTNSVDKVGKLIDVSIKAGANKVRELNFGYDSEQSVCNDLFPQIVKDAQSRASIIARSLNKKISGIQRINTSCSPQYNNMRVQYRSLGAEAGISNSSIPTVVEPGKIKIYASIDADFNVQ